MLRKKKAKRLKACIKQGVLLVLTVALCLSSTVSIQSATTIRKPRIVKSDKMRSGQKVTYDCVNFGSYPQAEVIGSESMATTIHKSIRNGKDYIVDKKLYQKLKNAKNWSKTGDITIDGEKYRRVKKSDATHVNTETYKENNYYQWNGSYHYFKYQPIKWRVIYKTKKEMFLLADLALDCQRYDNQKYDGRYAEVTWSTSTVRSWLNGYGSDSNAQGQNYQDNSFIKTAFTKKQADTILNGKVINSNNLMEDNIQGGNTTYDKIFFLSEKQVYTDNANKYGFVSDCGVWDEARRVQSSSYAKAMGCWSTNEKSYAGNSYWWLRSPGNYPYKAIYTGCRGWVSSEGFNVDDVEAGVRPALKINLESSAQYKYAGTVCTDGTVKKP